MSHRNKFIGLSILALTIFVVTGCGQKSVTNNAPSTSNPVSQSSDQPSQTIPDENLPKPTGKVSDTVNAIEDEADGEKNMTTQEDTEAQNAINDQQEANDFGATANETNL